MAFPPPADPSVDWSKLGLAINDMGAGHIESRYSVATGAWSAPKLVQDPVLRMHGLSPALNYGMQAYEGLKAYRSPANKLLLFRPARHARRMGTSTAAVSIPEIPEAHFQLCVELAVACNASVVPPTESGGCLYIRPVAFGTSPHLGLTPPTEFAFCVYVHPFGTYHGAAPLDALVLDEFDRAAPRGTGNAKVGGNYAPVMRHTDRARAEGYPLTLHLDPATRTLVDEFSTSAFIGLIKAKDGGVTLVHPDSQTVIDSVTADSAAQLARSFGWAVERRPVAYDELATFTEVLAAGTAAALVPVRSITRRTDSGEEKVRYEGTELFQKLYDSLRGIQAGKVADPFGWCDEIKPAEGYLGRAIEVVAAEEPTRTPAAEKTLAAGQKKQRVSGFALGASIVGLVSIFAIGARK